MMKKGKKGEGLRGRFSELFLTIIDSRRNNSNQTPPTTTLICDRVRVKLGENSIRELLAQSYTTAIEAKVRKKTNKQ